jgi:hypothetical protein
MPVIRPEELMLIPAGKDPPITLKLTGACPPDVINWYEYA